MPFKPYIILVGEGTPVVPPPPEPPPTCHACGNCEFSENSILMVEKTAWSCNGGNPSSVTLKEDWPFELATSSIVRYRYDASNFADYHCSLHRWIVTATGASFDTSDVCLTGYDGSIQLDTCVHVEIRHIFNNSTYIVFDGTLILNNCIPSIPV